MKKPTVSIVVPTYNCQNIIEDCLRSIKKQTYKSIELIIVDSFSTDNTSKIARKYGKVYSFGRDPSQKNIFAVPYQRNYGVSKAKGDFVYYVDSDMRMGSNLIEVCVREIKKENADALIVPEKSYGQGFWAKCRVLERDCYYNSENSYVEAARFIRKDVWRKLKGLDASLGGRDDFDFQLRLNEEGYKTIKSSSHIMHDEGRLTLGKQIRKKFIYGKNALDYFKKHRSRKNYLTKQYFIIRPEFIENFNLLAQDPVHAIGMIFMKLVEYSAGLCGLLYSLINREKITLIDKQTYN